MAKRTKRAAGNPAEIELVAPVTFRAQACRQADEYGIPQTVYFVVDREDCRWFHVSHECWHEYASRDLHVAPLVTMLPNRYFVR